MTSVLSQLPPKPLETAQKINNKRIRVPPRVTLGELTPANIGTLKKLCNVLFPIAFSDKFYKEALDLSISPEDYNKLVFYQDLAVGNLVARLEPISSPLPTTLSTSISPIVAPIASTSSAIISKTTASTPAIKNVSNEPYKLYIMTLGVLAPYRNQGLATKLIQSIITSAEASHYPPEPSSIKIKLPTTEEPVDKKKKLSPTAIALAEKEAKEKAAEEAAKRPRVESIYLHVQEGNEDGMRFWLKNGFVVKGTVENYYRKITPRNAILMERLVTKV